MTLFKYLIVFVALFACTWAVSNSWGNRNPTDVLLMNQTIVRNAIALSFIEMDVAFPSYGQFNNRTISAIYANDRLANNAGATNTLWSGGVGYKYATLRLRSQQGQGINTNILVYGN